MSDNDDPFGRRDRTIVRPNPRRQRPAASDPVPGPAEAGAAVRSPPPAPKSPPAPSVADDRPAPLSPRIAGDLVADAGDPIMNAATSLLLLLGRLRASLSRAVPAELTGQVARALEKFETDVRAAGVPNVQVAAAKYALAATADDIVLALPKPDDAASAPPSMLTRLFDERPGGARFFQEVERAKQNPTVNLGLLELMHACISLGFEGKFRGRGGADGLRKERLDLFETIRRNRPTPVAELSPNWRGQEIAIASRRLVIPVWSVAALALAILFAVYLFARQTLSARADALAVDLERVHPETRIAFARPEPVKPPVVAPVAASSQLTRVRSALADEIMAKTADVSQTGTRLVITINNRLLFPAGAAKLGDSFGPLAAKIAKSLDKEPGEIRVEAYTDNVPIKTLAFASNSELSEARAKAVATVLKADLAHPDRVRASGRGAASPVAPNDVEANKAKNRRVEISVARVLE